MEICVKITNERIRCGNVSLCQKVFARRDLRGQIHEEKEMLHKDDLAMVTIELGCGDARKG